MFDSGYLTLVRPWGVPVRLHWTAPLGALLFGGFAFRPGFWAGFLLLVLGHELGHAFLVRRLRLALVAVEVHGLGGQCRFSGQPSERERSIVAWGGVLAQAALGVLTLALVLVLGAPSNVHVLDLAYALTWTNLWVAGLNLLPFAPLDGHQAWRLFRRRARGGHRVDAPRPRPDGRGARDAKTRRRGPRGDDGIVEVDEGEVKETILDALDRAARDAKTKRRERS